MAPGWVDTDLDGAFVGSMPGPAAFRQGLGRLHPVGRAASPEDVAAPVARLASEESGFVAGQVLVADGGRTATLSLP